MSIQVIATDLDGTLWDRSVSVHPRTRAALESLAGRGVPVLAATGRRPRSARIGMEANGVLLPTVALDGTIGEHEPLGGRRFHLHPFAPDRVRPVLDVFLDHGLAPCVFVDDPEIDVLLDPAASTHPDHVRLCEQDGLTLPLAGWEPDRIVLSYSIIGAPSAPLRETARALRDRSLAAVSVSADPLYGGFSLSAVPLGVSKWSGVEAFCADRGLDARSVLAIGDAHNDLEMLRAAAVAVAVEGAADEVLEAVDATVDRPERGGWAQVLEMV